MRVWAGLGEGKATASAPATCKGVLRSGHRGKSWQLRDNGTQSRACVHRDCRCENSPWMAPGVPRVPVTWACGASTHACAVALEDSVSGCVLSLCKASWIRTPAQTAFHNDDTSHEASPAVPGLRGRLLLGAERQANVRLRRPQNHSFPLKNGILDKEGRK